MSEYRKHGREFTWGVIDTLAMVALIWLALGFLLWPIAAYFTPLDDSDTSFWKRSGVEIVTDAKTGQQYLVTRQGGIVRRGE